MSSHRDEVVSACFVDKETHADLADQTVGERINAGLSSPDAPNLARQSPARLFGEMAKSSTAAATPVTCQAGISHMKAI